MPNMPYPGQSPKPQKGTKQTRRLVGAHKVMLACVDCGWEGSLSEAIAGTPERSTATVCPECQSASLRRADVLAEDRNQHEPLRETRTVRTSRSEIHPEPSPLAEKTVLIKPGALLPNVDNEEPVEFRVEDWWDRVNSGTSWMLSNGNFAALNYAHKVVKGRLPEDDEVLYGKVGSLGYLVHVSELHEPQSDEEHQSEQPNDHSTSDPDRGTYSSGDRDRVARANYHQNVQSEGGDRPADGPAVG